MQATISTSVLLGEVAVKAVGTELGNQALIAVVAGQHIERVTGTEIASTGLQYEGANQMTGRAIHKRRPVPILAWVDPRRVQRMAGRGRLTSVMIDLTYLVGNRPEQMRIGNCV